MRRLTGLIIFFIAFSAWSQSYHVGATYTPLTIGSGGCNQTLYDPTLYVLPSGDLHLLSQGGNLGDSCSRGIDSFYGGTRDHTYGVWTMPGDTQCAEFLGDYTRCNYSPSNHGPIASPSVVQVPGDSRYFMAFSGGNADYFTGKVYWAVSSDGVSWSVYNWNPPPGETWTPVLYGQYAGDCSGNGSNPSGIGQLQLAYEGGLFYVFMSYYHYPYGYLSTVAYRFDYSSGHPFGFGPSVRQVFHNGTWENNSGRFVWDYDGQGSDGTLLPNGDHVVGVYNSTSSYSFGAADLKHDDNQGWWVHVNAFGGETRWQTSTSLASASWGPTSLVGNLPGNAFAGGAGLWFGSLSGSTNRMWIWLPASTGCSGFAGLSLVPATLDYP